MTDIPIKIQFVKSLSTAQPSRIVAVKADGDTNFTLYVTDKNGLPFPLKETSSGIVTAIQNTDGKLVITGSDTKTINVAPALLSLINSALQAGDNVSELVNDASYITLADIPTFVASDYDLEDFTNAGVDPYAHLSDLSAGTTNLSYTASPTQGIVSSDTGTDATIPLADSTNAGLLEPSKYTILENTSGTNTGDQDLQSVLEKGNTTTEPFYNEFDAGSGNYVRSGVISILGAPFPIVGQSTNNSGQLTEMAIAPHANGGFIVHKTGIVNKKINFLLPDKTNILYPSPNSYTLATLDDIPTPIDISGKVPYTGATTDIDLGEYQVKVGQIELDQTPTGTFSTAKIRWNDTAGTAEMRLKGNNVTLQIGQELVKRVVNKTATNITLQESNYQVVRIIGATGQRLSVDLAQADSEANSASTLGLVTENITNNQEGFITFSGEINLINTTGSLQGETWVDGNVLYLSPTIAGQLTNIEPIAPDRKIRVGYVQHTHATQGKIHVDVDRGYSLENLHNVKITATTAGKVLGSTTEGLWENKTIPDALGFTPENITNKSDSYTTSSSITYVSGKALVEGLGTKQNTLTNPVTGTGVGGQVSFWDGTNTQTGDNGLLWDNTNSYFEVNGNAPRFTLKNNLNNFSTYFTNDAYGTLFLKNHQDKTLAVFSNPVNSTSQPQMAIGNVSSIPTESQLYVYGGMNGANIDARGSATVDECNIDLEGNDWTTSPNSLGFSYFGSSATAFGTMMGYAKNKLGIIRFQDTNYAIINSDKSTGVSPIRFGINQIEIGNVNDKGFSYQSDFSSVNSSNPRWLADKGYVDTKAPVSGSANYIQNQNASAQSANMWISGSIKAGAATFASTVTAPTFIGSLTGTAMHATYWGGRPADLNAIQTDFDVVLTRGAADAVTRLTPLPQFRNWLGLGSNAYTSTAYLPLTGGTLSGSVTLTGIPTAPTAAPGTTGNQIATLDYVQANSRPYKVYTALLSQSGTNAPTATVLENTLGGTIVWGRSNAGFYTGTLTSAFPSGKTFYPPLSSTGPNENIRIYNYISNTSQIRVDTYFLSANSDGILNNNTIEIRVYN